MFLELIYWHDDLTQCLYSVEDYILIVLKTCKLRFNTFSPVSFRLIGTDALARGIDVPDCNYVISYDPPRNIKTYIHRVGRTGRAGKAGQAVTVLLPNQTNLFKVYICQ